MTDLAGKTAFITGGASGIGRSIAKLVAGRGGLSIIADINPEAVRRTGEELGCEYYTLDVSDIDATEALARKIWVTHDGVDLVFACLLYTSDAADD